MSSEMNKKSDIEQSQWMFLIDDSTLEQDKNNENTPTFCKLRHPKSDSGAMFLFHHENRKLCEVIQFKEEFRSWFIGETVQKDGSLFMLTPCNPVYLIIPYLIKAEKDGKFMQLEQLVTDSDYPECHRLCSCEDISELDMVSDVKGDDDLKVYRYNKDKTLSWLKDKVDKIADTLESKKVNTSSGSLASTYIQSGDDNVRDDSIRYAHGMLSDYLTVSLAKELKDFLGIKDIIVHDKPELNEPASKKARKGDITPTEDYSKQSGDNNNSNKKEKALTTAQKKLSKVDTKGMKSMMSFFKKK